MVRARSNKPEIAVTFSELATRRLAGRAIAITKARGTLIDKEGLPPVKRGPKADPNACCEIHREARPLAPLTPRRFTSQRVMIYLSGHIFFTAMYTAACADMCNCSG